MAKVGMGINNVKRFETVKSKMVFSLFGLSRKEMKHKNGKKFRKNIEEKK